MGHHGPRNLASFPPTVTRIDCSDVAATQGDSGETHFSHQYYRLAPRVIADVVQVIAGKPPNQISGRLPDPGGSAGGRAFILPFNSGGGTALAAADPHPATVAALARAKAGPRGAKQAGKGAAKRNAGKKTREAQRGNEGEAAGRRLSAGGRPGLNAPRPSSAPRARRPAAARAAAPPARGASSITLRDHRQRRLDLLLRRLEHQFVVDLEQHRAPTAPPSRAPRSMRIMARRMMSAAVPWSGALIAARSTKARSEGFDELICGIVALRGRTAW